ncbi:MAG: M67 family metallopeptidase [Rhodospirillales bacterium]
MIVLPAPVRSGIESEAEATYPEECCGLLVGVHQANGTIVLERAVASPNVAEGRRRDRFEVDPSVRFGLARELAGTASAVVGHYHSHPDHAAEPSTTDRKMAFEPELVWLIVGVGRQRPAEPPRATAIRAYRIRADGRVRELPIVDSRPAAP